MADRSVGRGDGGALLASGRRARPPGLTDSERRQPRPQLRPVQAEAADGGDGGRDGTWSTVLQRQLHVAEDRRAGEEHQVQDTRVRRAG